MRTRVVALLGLWAVLSIAGCSCSKSKSGGSTGTAGGSSGGCGLRTCESAGATCGPIGDGCGGVLQCGDCPAGQFCGGGGASKCGASNCTPTTCAAQQVDCGVISDGCGSLLHCGAAADGGGGCAPGQFCGGGGPNRCGAGSTPDGGSATCVRRTCAEAGANCGPVADGCGGLLQCGSCSLPEHCGAGGRPSVCGRPPLPDGGSSCTNLCLRQTRCDAGSTTVTGKVYAPNGQDPLYGALVYVPNGAVQPFAPGISCLRCDSQVTGEPLVSTTTAADGTFTLPDVPAGADVPLVIQLGRWRRQVTIPSVAACGSTALPADLTRLPRSRAEGDIPLTAVVTGNVDALECVLRKIGLQDAEFANPGDPGRVQLYWAQGDGGGSVVDSATPSSAALLTDGGALAAYDMVLFACEGFQHNHRTAELANVRDYANAGGRVFATHFNYTWLDTPTTWEQAATWNLNAGRGQTITGQVDRSFAKGQAFSDWLDAVGASTSPGSGQISITEWRWDVDAVTPPTQGWITIDVDGGTPVQHLTFNTPYGAQPQDQCGRVLFSDFHVANATDTGGLHFPAECGDGPLTAQEHVLEFMLFDLASCITPDQPFQCTPLTCAQAGAGCGPIGDGCGGSVDCGGCPDGQTCGGGGTPSQCGAPTCQPLTCAAQGVHCGPAGDGCGGTVECGSCPAGETCGGGGVAYTCGKPPCTPTTCADQHAECGPIADGCGGTLDCGTCPNGLTCGLLGANLCGAFR